jgi:hypothetical protein
MAHVLCASRKRESAQQRHTSSRHTAHACGGKAEGRCIIPLHESMLGQAARTDPTRHRVVAGGANDRCAMMRHPTTTGTLHVHPQKYNGFIMILMITAA